MNYLILPLAPERLRSNEQVRSELRKLVATKRAQKAYHIEAWETSPQGSHELPCNVCNNYEQEVSQIRSIIRHFGGRPRQ